MEYEVKLGKRKRSLSFRAYNCPSAIHSGNERKKLKSDVKYPEDDEVIIVKEIIRNDAFEQLDGSYYCKVCEISLNSRRMYNDHITGKKHQKKLKSRMPDDEKQSLLKDQTTYMPHPDVPRRNFEDAAVIQRAAECLNVPALNYVIEIQSLKETYYRCNLCNTLYYLHEVLSHLSEFEHKLKCVKLYDFAAYRKIAFMDKWEAEEKLQKTLKRLVNLYGYGKIVVEKTISDTRDSWNYNSRREKTKYYSRQRSYYSDKDYRFSGRFTDKKNTFECNRYNSTRRSSMYEEPDYKVPEDKFFPLPDVSKFDFYCQTCDAHMNDKNMWEKHIIGARHVKNYNKELGQPSSKLKSVVIPNARPKIMDTLDEIIEPVVGLDAIQEIYDTNLSVYKYNCFLCGSFLTSLEIIDHILSLKHKNKFLEKIKYPAKDTLQQLNLSESSKESIIADMCADVEAKNGRGTVEVRTTDFKWNRKQHISRYASTTDFKWNRKQHISHYASTTDFKWNRKQHISQYTKF